MATADTILDQVRELLTRAGDPAVTPAEADALIAEAAGLMARYGIDRARLAAARPDTDTPADLVIAIPDPWGTLGANLLCRLAGAMRCQAIELDTSDTRVHVFGYQSDLVRVELLFPSLLLQMAHGLAAAPVPAAARSDRGWRGSWQLGFISAVTGRVRQAEERAAADASSQPGSDGPPAAAVIADRALIVQRRFDHAYPDAERAQVIFTATGYCDGCTTGRTADIGSTPISPGGAPAPLAP